MLDIGNNKKIIIGIMALLALILLGYNISKFVSLYDVPLVGASSQSRLASEKWRRLEDLDSAKKENNWAEKIESLTSEITPQEAKVEETAPVQKQAIEQHYEAEVIPEITGIIKISRADGSSRSAVIIKNKLYYENEMIEGFSIKEITEKGIFLTKGKRSLFVNAPAASFSVDRGN